jgi:(2Fe-2S) ferredoxin
MAQNAQNLFETHLFVCELCDHATVPEQNPKKIRKAIKELCKQNNPDAKVRINGSGCLGMCEKGINAVLYPEGLWFHELQEKDVEMVAQVTLDAHQARKRPSPS